MQLKLMGKKKKKTVFKLCIDYIIEDLKCSAEGKLSCFIWIVNCESFSLIVCLDFISYMFVTKQKTAKEGMADSKFLIYCLTTSIHRLVQTKILS